MPDNFHNFLDKYLSQPDKSLDNSKIDDKRI